MIQDSSIFLGYFWIPSLLDSKHTCEYQTRRVWEQYPQQEIDWYHGWRDENTYLIKCHNDIDNHFTKVIPYKIHAVIHWHVLAYKTVPKAVISNGVIGWTEEGKTFWKLRVPVVYIVFKEHRDYSIGSWNTLSKLKPGKDHLNQSFRPLPTSLSS